MKKTYIKSEVTSKQILDLTNELYNNAKFNEGDIVQLNTMECPKMTIQDILVKSSNDFNTNITTLYLEYNCIYWSKGSSMFITRNFPEAVLDKVE